jgi:hypothetical protein
MKRTALLRRSPRAQAIAQDERDKNRHARQQLEAVSTVPRLHRGTYAGTTAGPAPKENVLESPAYENAVRALGVCVRCWYACRPQFCHTDQGKGAGIKTDVRLGWAGCGPHGNSMGCHHYVGTSGSLSKEERREEDRRLSAITRRLLRQRGLWPASVPEFIE